VDRAPTAPAEAALARVATAIGKYWICRRAPAFVNEAQECLGGAGYVEESILPRLFRQSPLNGIWEGSGNIQCLDVLRALAKEPECGQVLLAELAAARGLDHAYDRQFEVVAARWPQATPSRPAPACWWNILPCCCRPACCCAPAARPPSCSVARAWVDSTDWHWARCRPGSISAS